MFRAHKFDIIDFLRNRTGFTLLELLVSLTILSIIVVMLLQIINSASTNWQRVTDNAKAFESARAAFELLQQTLSQATLAESPITTPCVDQLHPSYAKKVGQQLENMVCYFFQ